MDLNSKQTSDQMKKTLTLEERHSKSLEASQQISKNLCPKLFLPQRPFNRHSLKLRKAHLKTENYVNHLAKRYLCKRPYARTASCKAVEKDNNNCCQKSTDTCQNIERLEKNFKQNINSLASAPTNVCQQTPAANLRSSESKLTARESAIKYWGTKLKVEAENYTADPKKKLNLLKGREHDTKISNDLKTKKPRQKRKKSNGSIEEPTRRKKIFKTATGKNLKKSIYEEIDIKNTNCNQRTNFNYFSNDENGKIPKVKINIKYGKPKINLQKRNVKLRGQSTLNSLKKSTLDKEKIDLKDKETEIKSLKKTHLKSFDEGKQILAEMLSKDADTILQTAATAIGDFQNAVRTVLSQIYDSSEHDKQINEDLLNLEICMDEYSNSTISCTAPTTAESSDTFTIFIEADTILRKSITYKTADILNPPEITFKPYQKSRKSKDFGKNADKNRQPSRTMPIVTTTKDSVLFPNNSFQGQENNVKKRKNVPDIKKRKQNMKRVKKKVTPKIQNPLHTNCTEVPNSTSNNACIAQSLLRNFRPGNVYSQTISNNIITDSAVKVAGANIYRPPKQILNSNRFPLAEERHTINNQVINNPVLTENHTAVSRIPVTEECGRANLHPPFQNYKCQAICSHVITDNSVGSESAYIYQPHAEILNNSRIPVAEECGTTKLHPPFQNYNNQAMQATRNRVETENSVGMENFHSYQPPTEIVNDSRNPLTEESRTMGYHGISENPDAVRTYFHPPRPEILTNIQIPVAEECGTTNLHPSFQNCNNPAISSRVITENPIGIEKIRTYHPPTDECHAINNYGTTENPTAVRSYFYPPQLEILNNHRIPVAGECGTTNLYSHFQNYNNQASSRVITENSVGIEKARIYHPPTEECRTINNHGLTENCTVVPNTSFYPPPTEIPNNSRIPVTEECGTRYLHQPFQNFNSENRYHFEHQCHHRSSLPMPFFQNPYLEQPSGSHILNNIDTLNRMAFGNQ